MVEQKVLTQHPRTPCCAAMGVTSALESVWESVFHEGVNTPTHRIMNMAFYGLFITLIGLLLASGGNGHVLAFLVLSVCLFMSVNWYVARLPRFIAELEQAKKAQNAAEKSDKAE